MQTVGRKHLPVLSVTGRGVIFPFAIAATISMTVTGPAIVLIFFDFEFIPVCFCSRCPVEDS